MQDLLFLSLIHEPLSQKRGIRQRTTRTGKPALPNYTTAASIAQIRVLVDRFPTASFLSKRLQSWTCMMNSLADRRGP